MTSHGDREKFDVSCQDSTEMDKFTVFENWLLDNGAKFPKLELREYSSEVRGCHTKEDIDPDEVIIEIPLNCLITVEMGKDTDIGRKVLMSDVNLDAPKHIFLMLFMLVDRKRPDSFFKPYYDILPATLSNMPIFWSEEELSHLQGSYILQQVDERNLAIENDYRQLCSLDASFADLCTLTEFAWARMCVCSRNFGIVANGLRTAALVPYADMLNHYRPRETKWQFDDDLQSFTVISLSTIASSAQVYDSYGQKCNHRFLLNYGFSVENNVEPDGFCPNEVAVYVFYSLIIFQAPVLLSLDDTDVLFPEKYALWNRETGLLSKRIHLCVAENDAMMNAIGTARLLAADKNDLKYIYETSRYPSAKDFRAAINLRNEIRALKHLHAVCQDYLSRYKTTYEEDCALLQSDKLQPFSNHRNAIIQVKGEKEVLLFFQDFCDTALCLAHCKSLNEYEAAFATISSTKHPIIVKYCRHVISKLYQAELIKMQNVDMSKPVVV